MIIETIVSTVDENNHPNFAPMGVRFEGENLDIRPFSSSRTYGNLLGTGKGAVNIVDDVLLIVETALYSATPPYFKTKTGLPVLEDACSYFEFEVVECNSSGEPAHVVCKLLEKGYNKTFQGFCRASYVVIEAAILATRLHFLDKKAVQDKLDDWAGLVKKTGGEREVKAFNVLVDYVKAFRAV